MSRWTLPLGALAGAALGALAMLAWSGAHGGGQDVRGYLLAHPEVIQEAMQRLQDRETGKVVAANREAITAPLGAAWAGDPHGDVTVAEYFDYNCGYCRADQPVIAQLIAAEPHVRVVYRELPVLAASSRDAARLSVAAALQGKFQRFHDALFATPGAVTDAGIAAAARTAGVDMARAEADRPRADAAIRANYAIQQQLGMSGTPSWVVGDRVTVGAQTLDELRAAVAQARAARS